VIDGFFAMSASWRFHAGIRWSPVPKVVTMPRDDVVVSGPHAPEADLLQPFTILALLARALIAASIIAIAA
jgi:hypothetical protein